jgi:hypothetical protein
MNQRVEKDNDKSWDRHARILFLLQKKQTTITKLSSSIGEDIARVSDCIWGKRGRKNRRIEEKIANFLGNDRESLFKGE